MNLTQPFRELVEAVSAAISDTFDFTYARINAVWNVEHNADGSHRDITADSITVDTVTATTETVDTLDVGTLTVDTATVSTQLTSHGNTLVQPTANNVNGILVYIANGSTGIPITTRTDAGAAVTESHYGYSGGNPVQLLTLTLGSAGGGSWQAHNGGGTGGAFSWLDAAGNTLFDTGAWTAVTFSAGDFTASAGTWTLGAGDQALFRWRIIGKTIVVTFVLDTTSVSGGQSQLRIKIPGGFTAAQTAWLAAFAYNDNAAGWVTGGNAFVDAGQTYIALQLGTFGVSTWAAAVNTTAVRGTVTFEVQ